GKKVALGGRLGVLSEAVAMAVVLSHPPPFMRASHMVTGDPDEANAIVGRSFLAQSVFDRGLYSDTLASLRVLREYLVRAVGGNTPQKSFCRLFSLSYPKMEQLVSTLYAIHSRAAELAGEPIPMVPRDPASDPDLANTLRLLLAWTFPRNLIKMRVDSKQHAAMMEQKKRGTAVQVVLQGHAEEEGEGGEGGSNGFFSKEVDAGSDPIAAVVYSVTPPTNAERQGWEHAHNEVDGRNRLPIGQRRVCLVMSRRSAESHLKILKMGGAKDRRSWVDVKGKISSEEVPGVGGVETVDVPLTKANMKLFRVLLEERAGCAYAVTDAPMVQLEMSGEREATKEVLHQVFGVTSPFEGGRVGAPNQVIEFPRGNNNVEGCNSLVEDVPLGARMLAAMANANRAGGRKLRVWNDPIKRKEKLEVSLSLKQSVWFTKEGILPSSSSSSSSSASPSATSSTAAAETGGSGSRPQSGAAAVAAAAAAGPPKKERRRVVYTPANSVSASIVYQGRNRHVYAVASGIIQLPHGNAISEGVTVFPVGHHWVCLALLCAGTPISELPSHMHADLDKEQMDKAIEFANTFWSTSSTQERWRKVDAEGLRAMLREIFDDRALADCGGGGGGVSKKDAKDGLADGKDEVVDDEDDHDDDEDEDEDEHGTKGGGNDSGGGSSGYGYGSAPGSAATAGMVAEFQGGFDSASDYRGSPLAILREDPGLWKLGEREPARVREAAAGIGAAAAAAAAVEAVEGPLNGAKKEKMEMSPGLGQALMEWSESLGEAGRDMAALMGLQAVVMCILGVHRRNVLAGVEETPAAAAAIVGEASSFPAGEEAIAAAGNNGGIVLSAGEQQTAAVVGESRDDAPTPEGGVVAAAAAGDGAARGQPDDGFVYGDLARLEAEIFAATGVEDALLHLGPGGYGGGASGAGKGGVDAAAKKSSVLRGVPWLSFLDDDGDGDGAVGDVEGRLLVWRPPPVVAEALDADLDADPTGWLSGFGGGGIDGGGGGGG
ncbi:unnamed protein product, partial [Ectocarpus sp. 8 AP-2014]